VPHIGGRILSELRRSDIAALLDTLVERYGKAMADGALKVLSALCHWVETRDDTFRSPIVRGMKRAPVVHRDRTLSDDELRVVWKTASQNGPFGAFIQLALLTAQRYSKLREMRWDDVDANGVWHIPRQAREKQTGGDLKLPPLALEIIYNQPRIIGETRILRFPQWHPVPRFQKAASIAPWRIHDLRCTARSLMSRAGVQTEISELVLGHCIKGIQKVYDRHSYFEEKGAALAKLAALIERIINAPADNVVALHEAVS
jgi:integrase